MNYSYTDSHTDSCIDLTKRTEEQLKENSFSFVHRCYHKTLLLQIDFEFYLIHYPACRNPFHSKLDFVEEIINSINSHKIINKPFNRGDVFNRIHHINRSKKNIREYIANLADSNFREIIYTYEDAAGKDYCFSLNHYGVGCISKNAIKYDKSYNETLKFIEENFESHEKVSLIKQAEELHSLNRIFYKYDEEYALKISLEQTIKDIKNKLKEL